MPKIAGKLDQKRVEDPAGREPDPWADFREIELIGLNWEQSYRHSLGKYSRFFLELENRRFFGTRCSDCDKVWAPPRPLCPDCLSITSWIELTGRGSLAGFSVLHYAPAQAASLETPYVLAYVQLEGADTLFAHLLKNYGDVDSVQIGMPVQVIYEDQPVDHPIHLMAFEPVKE